MAVQPPRYVNGEPAAVESDIGRLARAVRDFKERYEQLTNVSYGARIARTGNNELMQEYGNTIARMDRIKAQIEGVQNLWDRAREFVGLGVVPFLIPVAVAVALTATVIAGIRAMDEFFRRSGIATIQAQNPTMSYADAAELYNSSRPESVVGQTFSLAKLALWGGIAFLGYKAMQEWKR